MLFCTMGNIQLPAVIFFCTIFKLTDINCLILYYLCLCKETRKITIDQHCKMIISVVVLRSILWKESLNMIGHQFHQYQQNEQSPLILTEQKKKRPRHMTLEI